MTVILRVLTYVVIFATVVFISEFDIGGEAGRASIFAGTGAAALALFLYLDWRDGSL